MQLSPPLGPLNFEVTLQTPLVKQHHKAQGLSIQELPLWLVNYTKGQYHSSEIRNVVKFNFYVEHMLEMFQLN